MLKKALGTPLGLSVRRAVSAPFVLSAHRGCHVSWFICRRQVKSIATSLAPSLCTLCLPKTVSTAAVYQHVPRRDHVGRVLCRRWPGRVDGRAQSLREAPP